MDISGRVFEVGLTYRVNRPVIAADSVAIYSDSLNSNAKSELVNYSSSISSSCKKMSGNRYFSLGFISTSG